MGTAEKGTTLGDLSATQEERRGFCSILEILKACKLCVNESETPLMQTCGLDSRVRVVGFKSSKPNS